MLKEEFTTVSCHRRTRSGVVEIFVQELYTTISEHSNIHKDNVTHIIGSFGNISISWDGDCRDLLDLRRLEFGLGVVGEEGRHGWRSISTECSDEVREERVTELWVRYVTVN